MARSDPASQSNYISIRTTDMHLDWIIDWDSRIITGSITHTLLAQHDGVDEVCFDASYLDISAASCPSSPLEYTLCDRHPVLGNQLAVRLAHKLNKNETVQVKIDYSTTKKCTAVGWLEAHQTATGKHPFLYSQCQAIHMRSLAPCMDTPAVKATYSAKVRSYLPVLLSALRVSPPSEVVTAISKDRHVEYVYRQPVPIPSYLIAIAAGEVAYKRVGKRTGVWADPATLEKAVWEFEEDMEIFLEHAEKVGCCQHLCTNPATVSAPSRADAPLPPSYYLLMSLETMTSWSYRRPSPSVVSVNPHLVVCHILPAVDLLQVDLCHVDLSFV